MKYEYTNIELICLKNDSGNVVAALQNMLWWKVRTEDYATEEMEQLRSQKCVFLEWSMSTALYEHKQEAGQYTVHGFYVCSLSHYITHCLLALSTI